MPTSREIVANRPLSGAEVRAIMDADIRRILDNDCMLTELAAYRRLSYEIRVTMHLDNLTYPQHEIQVRSQAQPRDLTANSPQLAAVEPGPPPLSDPSAASYVSATELHRDIDSPNVARVEHSLPVTITRTQESGKRVDESVHYPPEMLEEPGPAPVVTDLSDETREAFGLPSAPEPATPEPPAPPAPAKPAATKRSHHANSPV